MDSKRTESPLPIFRIDEICAPDFDGRFMVAPAYLDTQLRFFRGTLFFDLGA